MIGTCMRTDRLGAIPASDGVQPIPAGLFGDVLGYTVDRSLGRAEGLGVGLVVGGLAGALAVVAAQLYFGRGRR